MTVFLQQFNGLNGRVDEWIEENYSIKQLKVSTQDCTFADFSNFYLAA